MKKILFTLSFIFLFGFGFAGNNDGNETNPNKDFAVRQYVYTGKMTAPAPVVTRDKKVIISYFSYTGDATVSAKLDCVDGPSRSATYHSWDAPVQVAYFANIDELREVKITGTNINSSGFVMIQLWVKAGSTWYMHATGPLVGPSDVICLY